MRAGLQIAALRMDVQRLTTGKRAAEAQLADLKRQLAAASPGAPPGAEAAPLQELPKWPEAMHPSAPTTVTPSQPEPLSSAAAGAPTPAGGPSAGLHAQPDSPGGVPSPSAQSHAPEAGAPRSQMNAPAMGPPASVLLGAPAAVVPPPGVLPPSAAPSDLAGAQEQPVALAVAGAPPASPAAADSNAGAAQGGASAPAGFHSPDSRGDASFFKMFSDGMDRDLREDAMAAGVDLGQLRDDMKAAGQVALAAAALEPAALPANGFGTQVRAGPSSRGSPWVPQCLRHCVLTQSAMGLS